MSPPIVPFSGQLKYISAQNIGKLGNHFTTLLNRMSNLGTKNHRRWNTSFEDVLNGGMTELVVDCSTPSACGKTLVFAAVDPKLLSTPGLEGFGQLPTKFQDHMISLCNLDCLL